jgi:hypothetical protein
LAGVAPILNGDVYRPVSPDLAWAQLARKLGEDAYRQDGFHFSLAIWG